MKRCCLLGVLVFILFSCDTAHMRNRDNLGTPPVLENVTYSLKGYVPDPSAPPRWSDGSIIEIRFMVNDPDLDAEKLVIQYAKIEDAVYDLPAQTQETQEYLIEDPYIDVYMSGDSFISIIDKQGNISNKRSYQAAPR